MRFHHNAAWLLWHYLVCGCLIQLRRVGAVHLSAPLYAYTSIAYIGGRCGVSQRFLYQVHRRDGGCDESATSSELIKLASIVTYGPNSRAALALVKLAWARYPSLIIIVRARQPPVPL